MFLKAETLRAFYFVSLSPILNRKGYITGLSEPLRLDKGSSGDIANLGLSLLSGLSSILVVVSPTNEHESIVN